MFENFTEDSGEGVKLQMNDVRSFAVILDSDNDIIRKPTVTYYTEQEIETYIAQILNGKTPKHFLVSQKNIGSGKLIAWVDRSIEAKEFNSLTLTVCLVGVGGMLLLLVLVWFLSFWIVRPAVQGIEKQKRFISEASHELKTPLTIISAGVELLQKQKGNNTDAKKWLNDIKIQTEKMTVMTAALLSLSRLSETTEVPKADFDMSQAVEQCVLSFDSVAYEQGKELLHDLDANVAYKGNAIAISQAVSILCDNAIKHSNAKAIIKVTLKKQNGRITLSVINTGDGITESEMPFLFDRFYRGSESRAETQGTGLGLAILKTLAEQNGWKIDVKSNADKTVFSILF